MKSAKIMKLLEEVTLEILSLNESMYKQQLYIKATEAATWGNLLRAAEKSSGLYVPEESQKPLIVVP